MDDQIHAEKPVFHVAPREVSDMGSPRPTNLLTCLQYMDACTSQLLLIKHTSWLVLCVLCVLLQGWVNGRCIDHSSSLINQGAARHDARLLFCASL